MLFVSHNMAAVESLCHRGLMLQDGAVVCEGPISEALAAYRQSWNRRATPLPKADTDANAIRRVELINDGSHAEHLELGRPLVIEIDVDFSDVVFSPTVGIGIDNSWGQRILSLHTHRTRPLAATMSGRSRIWVTVPQCPLAPAGYALRVVISSRNGDVATLDRALTFAVIDAEAFGEGRRFHRGYCIAPTTWRSWRAAAHKDPEVTGTARSVASERVGNRPPEALRRVAAEAVAEAQHQQTRSQPPVAPSGCGHHGAGPGVGHPLPQRRQRTHVGTPACFPRSVHGQEAVAELLGLARSSYSVSPAFRADRGTVDVGKWPLPCDVQRKRVVVGRGDVVLRICRSQCDVTKCQEVHRSGQASLPHEDAQRVGHDIVTIEPQSVDWQGRATGAPAMSLTKANDSTVPCRR